MNFYLLMKKSINPFIFLQIYHKFVMHIWSDIKLNKAIVTIQLLGYYYKINILKYQWCNDKKESSSNHCINLRVRAGYLRDGDENFEPHFHQFHFRRFRFHQGRSKIFWICLLLPKHSYNLWIRMCNLLLGVNVRRGLTYYH